MGPRVVEQARGALAWVLWVTGITALMRAIIRPQGAAILVYHSIGGQEVFPDNVVSLKHFTQHVEFLQKHYVLVDVSKIVERIKSNLPVPDNWVAITFDDGYKDNLLNGAPVLKKANAPATFFITTDVMAGKKSFFYDLIFSALKRRNESGADRLNVDGEDIRLNRTSLPYATGKTLTLTLKWRNLHPEVIDKHLMKVVTGKGLDSSDINLDQIYLCEEDVVELQVQGFNIGSHTVSHPRLSKLDESDGAFEIENSKAALEAVTNRSIAGFAYPFGKKDSYSSRDKAQLRTAGYDYAVTTENARVTHSCDPFELPRIGVRDIGTAGLRLGLLGLKL